MGDLTDLVVACGKGERKAQRLLFERLKNRWMGICFRYMRDRAAAEDVLQEAAVKIFTNVSTLKSPVLFDAWAKRIVINEAIDHLKSKHSYSLAISSYTDEQVELEYREEREIISRLDEAVLIEIINTMPEGYRVVFNLFMIDGYKHEEIAKSLGITAATSRSQLKKAKRSLRKKLEQLKLERNARIVR